MPGPEIDLLAIDRGTVTAPAGCGKTHLIAEALKNAPPGRPALVLTHTNAGVAALRGRLTREGVSQSAYRLATIDGWAMRLASMFPVRAGLDPAVLALNDPRRDYPAIREAAAQLLGAGHISEIISANYGRLLVDEYQDCSAPQHAIVVHAAQLLPTCVLGDPLQAIFGFGGARLVNWEKDVCSTFPEAARLGTPWRWINAGAEALGRWLLDVRQTLVQGGTVDLGSAPDHVTWVELDGTHADHMRRVRAARTRPPGGDGAVLIIGDSINANSRYHVASAIPGAVTVEAVDLRDLLRFARNLDLAADNALSSIASFAQTLMTGVGAADLLRRVAALTDGRARKEPSSVEMAAIRFLQERSPQKAADLLAEMGSQPATNVYRPLVLHTCIRALRMCAGDRRSTFGDAVINLREQYRARGRSLPRRAIGSTLLLKGLESEAAVVLHGCELGTRNFYVAITRGSTALTVCSRTRVLQPSRLGVA